MRTEYFLSLVTGSSLIGHAAAYFSNTTTLGACKAHHPTGFASPTAGWLVTGNTAPSSGTGFHATGALPSSGFGPTMKPFTSEANERTILSLLLTGGISAGLMAAL